MHKSKWGEAIKDLLEKNGLSLRGAAQKTKHAVSHTYISDWLTGKEPQYHTAVAFLEHFPRDQAIECLAAAGYPPPIEWVEADKVNSASKTLGLTLMPTKGALSYEEIASKVNEWLRNQMDNGRDLETQRVSAEYICMIFTDAIAQPLSIILEAIAVVQGVPLADLSNAAGSFLHVKNMDQVLAYTSKDNNISEENKELIRLANDIIANGGFPDSDDPILKEHKTKLIQMMRQIDRTIRSEAEGNTTE